MYFVVITDKIRKKFIVIKTSYMDAIESVFMRQDKEHYSVQAFSDKYHDRIERVEYIKFLIMRGYKFQYRLLFDFLK